MARPIKPKGEARNHLMQIRVKESEHDLFKKAADEFGLDVSGWVRERLIQAAKRDLKK